VRLKAIYVHHLWKCLECQKWKVGHTVIILHLNVEYDTFVIYLLNLIISINEIYVNENGLL
jgi:hypothetical protein